MMDGRPEGRETDSSDAARCDVPTQRKKGEVLQEESSDEVDRSSCHGGAKRGVSEGLRR